MSGKNPFLGMGFGSPFASFVGSSASGGGASSPRIVVGSFFDDDDGSASGSAYIYNLDGTGEVKVTASDAASGDRLGVSVAVGSNKIVVGSYGDDLEGGESGGHSSGSVYVYNIDGTNEVKLTASDAAGGDTFGTSVAIGSNKIVVGAPGNDDDGTSSGSVYVYNLDGTGEVKITASDAAGGDNFGFSVSVGSNKIVVGSINSNSDKGSAYIYNLDGTGEVKITASDGAQYDQFGISVSVGNDKIVVGARGDDDDGGSSGSAYIYDLDGTNEVKLTASDAAGGDFYGTSVAVG